MFDENNSPFYTMIDGVVTALINRDLDTAEYWLDIAIQHYAHTRPEYDRALFLLAGEVMVARIYEDESMRP